jgi:hypothetical protein
LFIPKPNASRARSRWDLYRASGLVRGSTPAVQPDDGARRRLGDRRFLFVDETQSVQMLNKALDHDPRHHFARRHERVCARHSDREALLMASSRPRATLSFRSTCAAAREQSLTRIRGAWLAPHPTGAIPRRTFAVPPRGISPTKRRLELLSGRSRQFTRRPQGSSQTHARAVRRRWRAAPGQNDSITARRTCSKPIERFFWLNKFHALDSQVR